MWPDRGAGSSPTLPSGRECYAWRPFSSRRTSPDVERAEQAILSAIRIHQEFGSRPELARSYVTYARLLRRWNRADEASRYRGEALDMFREMGMARDLAETEREPSGLA